MLRVPATRSEEALVIDLLERDGVVVHPGFFFDFPARGVPGRQPAARAAACSRAASQLHAGASRCRVISSTAATPGCSCRSSRCRRARAGASARSAICRGSARWMTGAGFSFVQLLPVNEMADGQNSPYSAMSAMAIDPIFISPAAVPDIAALGGEAPAAAGRARAARSRRARRRRSTTPPSARVKLVALRAALRAFPSSTSGRRDTNRALRPAGVHRARALVARRLRALPRAARAGARDAAWQRVGRAAPRSRARRARRPRASELDDRDPVSTRTCSGSPPTSGGRRARPAAIGVFGDFPFMVSGDSADVWARQQDFRLDASVGAPPDAFSETGQDWGFPAYRWDVDRGRRLSSGSRRARGAAPSSSTATASIISSASSAPTCARRTARPRSCRRTSPSRSRRAKRCSTCLRAHRRARSSPRISASFPTSCASRSTRLEIPGYKVLRWERDWDEDGQAVQGSARRIRRAASRRAARTTPRPIAEWWDEAPIDGAPGAGRGRSRRTAGSGPGAAVQRRDARRDPAAALRAPAPTSSCCRSRTCSAGATASTHPH